MLSVIPSALKGEPGLIGRWTNIGLRYQTLINENLKDYETLYWVGLNITRSLQT